MLIAYMPLLIAIIGLLMWTLLPNATMKEIGKILFLCGAMVLTFGLTGKTFRL